ncbi:hypothetical protein EV361DRAFT_289579 [Lentinula raphanica]|nr:hypothetical protein EV361DRAFT_289579 [Lentinula raphanica]
MIPVSHLIALHNTATLRLSRRDIHKKGMRRPRKAQLPVSQALKHFIIVHHTYTSKALALLKVRLPACCYYSYRLSSHLTPKGNRTSLIDMHFHRCIISTLVYVSVAFSAAVPRTDPPLADTPAAKSLSTLASIESLRTGRGLIPRDEPVRFAVQVTLSNPQKPRRDWNPRYQYEVEMIIKQVMLDRYQSSDIWKQRGRPVTLDSIVIKGYPPPGLDRTFVPIDFKFTIFEHNEPLKMLTMPRRLITGQGRVKVERSTTNSFRVTEENIRGPKGWIEKNFSRKTPLCIQLPLPSIASVTFHDPLETDLHYSSETQGTIDNFVLAFFQKFKKGTDKISFAEVGLLGHISISESERGEYSFGVEFHREDLKGNGKSRGVVTSKGEVNLWAKKGKQIIPEA